MAEIKNTFIKSKMNKDLDSRLVPNGEYREAINASVSSSEDADVGALENIISNNFLLEDAVIGKFINLSVIGYCKDEAKDRKSNLLYKKVMRSLIDRFRQRRCCLWLL